ncbi:NAD(P)-dependent oxidoreductase [Conexibacter sp. JD483]|uniref:NAD-dependent epimerase/dehydratase family protein n=1 Tax=unclassified Conexibacter TaxID=2627773 RepID=UPI0027284222|nr:MULTISPECIES: NAD(P)-dependent oxidoreductase [unclassified Conexibacter]MDO8187577.1 NAD(P)-dependent oxidoreductase [Conexibacter sp. CPCC 205706]MDO8198943.1 NAD(P)-dependent oxidoreductase [Conexibacter sp. CPCC 205762]MDR9370350.1 NAD(P)-dependent oxidoreductase [Conexibacter sp. JD483]
MNVLVTGAGGGIGRVVVAELAAGGHAVVALDRAGAGIPAGDGGAAAIHVGDCRDGALVRTALAGADAVVHLAGVPAPGIVPDPELFAGNTQATFTVLDEAVRAGVRRVVTASSVSILGAAWAEDHVSPLYLPLDEAHPLRPREAYALAKQCDEATEAMFCRRDGIAVVALRFPFTDTSAAIAARAARVAEDPAEGSRELWAYLDVRDAARACRLAVEATVAPGFHPVYVVADDTLAPLPTEQLVRAFHPETELRAPLPGRRTAYATARAVALLGFRAAHPRG